jgi:hypothetical protein
VTTSSPPDCEATAMIAATAIAAAIPPISQTDLFDDESGFLDAMIPLFLFIVAANCN